MHEFTVRGAGEFPFDMLRYDECYPKTGDDVASMLASRRREVTLITHRRFGPTSNRWASFMWSVTRG